MTDYKTIIESNNFIILDKYTKIDPQSSSYQAETDLEREFTAILNMAFNALQMPILLS